jgi:hypothetical protein
MGASNFTIGFNLSRIATIILVTLLPYSSKDTLIIFKQGNKVSKTILYVSTKVRKDLNSFKILQRL